MYIQSFYLIWCLEAVASTSTAGQWVQTSFWLKAQEEVLNSTTHPFVVFVFQLLSLILCNSMDCSTSGFPVLRCLLEFAQIRVHCQWCHPNISSSVVPFSSCPQSFPASGSFPISWLFASGGQSIRASTLAPVLPMNIQGWLPLGLTDLILLSKGLSRVFSSITIQKHEFFGTQPSLWSNLHMHTWLLEKQQQHEKFSAKWCLCFLICCLGLS